HNYGLLLEPDAAMVFGVSEAIGDRWHGGLDPASVGALRNELGAVSNSGYRKTLVATTAFSTGRNVIDRSRLLADEMRHAAEVAAILEKVLADSYQAQTTEIAEMLAGGQLSDMARHKTWSEAAVDLTAIITRRAGVAAQETARAWTLDETGSSLLEGEGTSLWRHTEDTSWDVQGRLEDWEGTLAQVAARNSTTGSLRPRAAKRLASRVWRLVVDPSMAPSWSIKRRFKENLTGFVEAAQGSLVEVVTAALEVDAARFRRHLEADRGLIEDLDKTIAAIAALLQGEPRDLESVVDVGEDIEEEPADA
ncbi:MAG: hypothetical protein QNJ77_04895, partial [Acidimicrobiia bacterium]|nr:hypothetical protein [Acidimicrobiia bacterium]